MKGIRWVYTPGELPKLQWGETKSGLFSVKSTYQLLEKTRKEDSRGECSQFARFRWLWRFTWKLGIPGKIKHFIWRAFHDSLPTNANLFRRKIKSHPFCLICNQEDESTSHVIWQCPMARNTWALVPGRSKNCQTMEKPFPCSCSGFFRTFQRLRLRNG